MKRTLLIMSKMPLPGTVKTRLRPFLTDVHCAEFAAALIEDCSAKAKEIGVETVFAVSPSETQDEFAAMLKNGERVIPQSGVDLGERMKNAFDDIFEAGSESIVMIGTDSPTMPPRTVNNAFEMLESGVDVVLGPAEDGGFYLIGLRDKPDAGLFKNVEWSVDETLEQVCQNLEILEMTVQMLPVGYDIDSKEDIKRLYQDLTTSPQLAETTASWLRKNSDLF